MDITDETQKLTSNPLIRYAILLIGLAVLIFSQGILTWKMTSNRDAAGSVDAIELEMMFLEKDISDSDDSAEKKDIRAQIKEIKEGELVDAQMEAASENVDAKNGIWLWSMAHLLGVGIISLGLIVIAAAGTTHEKLGALIAIGVIVARI